MGTLSFRGMFRGMREPPNYRKPIETMLSGSGSIPSLTMSTETLDTTGAGGFLFLELQAAP